MAIFEALHMLGISVTPTSTPQQIACPIHKGGSEVNPSARIYPDTDSIYCFTCNQSFSPVKLIATYHGITRVEAAKLVYGTSKPPEKKTGHGPRFSDELATVINAVSKLPLQDRIRALMELDDILVAASRGAPVAQLSEDLLLYTRVHFGRLVG